MMINFFFKDKNDDYSYSIVGGLMYGILYLK